MLTREEYAKKHGLICPYCEGKSLISAELQHDGEGVIWQETKCNDCWRSWHDEYKLVNFFATTHVMRNSNQGGQIDATSSKKEFRTGS